MMLRRTPQMLKKIKNSHKQKFEDEANFEHAIGQRGYSTKQNE